MTDARVIRQQQPERAEIIFLWLVTAYFTAQTLLRVFNATSLSPDEAEMLVVSQTLAFGYGASQPPLYGWLMLVAFKLLGASVPVLAGIKNLLLWTTFTLMYFASRDVLGSALKAALVSAALISVPQIGWKAQFDLTHSVLALTMAALTFVVFLRLLRSGQWLDYLLLGICFALGVLSKYNYAIFAVALLVGTVFVPSLRPRIVSPRMLFALGLCLLLLVPHFEWMWSHPGVALSRVSKLGIAEDRSVFSAAGASLVALIRALVSCALATAALLTLIAFVPLPRRASAPAEAEAGWPEAKQLVLNTLAVSAVFVLVLVIFSRSTTLRDHWFMPLLLLFPMGLFILFERHFTVLRMKLLAFACGGLALASLAALAVTHLFPDITGRPTRSSAPYGAIAQSIHDLGFREGYILADTTYVAGNLKLRFPGSTVGEVEYGFSPPAGGLERPLLIVWQGTDSNPPAKLKTLWAASCTGTQTEGSVTRITGHYERSRPPYVLNVLVQPGCRPKSG